MIAKKYCMFLLQASYEFEIHCMAATHIIDNHIIDIISQKT